MKALVLHALGAGMAAALAAEAVLALLAFGPPTLVMGALFSHLGTQARAAGVSFGRALGVNTLGAAAAPLLFGVLLVPRARAQARAAAGRRRLPGARRRGARWRTPSVWAPRRARWRSRCWRRRWRSSTFPRAAASSATRKASMAAVSVVEDADGVARLRINNRQQEGSSATLLADARQALLPLLLHPAPRRALFLGLGTGVTAASAADGSGAAGRRRRAAARGDRCVGHFTRAPSTARPSRGCT